MSTRAGLRALQRRIDRQKARTEEARVEGAAKRTRRRAPAPLALEPVEPVAKPINSTDVERWLKAGVAQLYGKPINQGRWGAKERKLAKNLLADFGPEMVERAVAHFCAHWKTMVHNSRGQLDGMPTINLLWGMRARVFAEVQGIDNTPDRSARPEDSDEYRGGSGAKGIGW